MVSGQRENGKMGKLLEVLQEESWQLELLVSGFAIFLVAGVWEPLNNFLVGVEMTSSGIDHSQTIRAIFFLTLVGSWFFLLTNLILHVFLRGLWIGTIGLRYVSGNIDLDKIKLAPNFDKFLRRTLPDFDEYIERLERICSIVFVFTFMLIFMLLSFCLVVLFLSTLFDFLINQLEPILGSAVKTGSTIVLLGIVIPSLFIYFIDFVSLGYIKRWKRFSKVYYPIYRFYGWITLAFLYRPLYYNLIDNKFSRVAGYLLVPYMFILSSLVTMKTESYLYFPDVTNGNLVNRGFYLDEMEDDGYINQPIIPHKVISNNFLELFIPYLGRDEKALLKVCPDLKAGKSIGTKFTIVNFDFHEGGSPADSVLLCYSSIFRIGIDDQEIKDPSYFFNIHKNMGEHGFMTMIDLDSLNRGVHRLNIEKQMVSNDSLSWVKIRDIPFWKEHKSVNFDQSEQ